MVYLTRASMPRIPSDETSRRKSAVLGSNHLAQSHPTVGAEPHPYFPFRPIHPCPMLLVMSWYAHVLRAAHSPRTTHGR